jgi:predicted transcriptional regulator
MENPSSARPDPSVTELTAEIVAAYVSTNTVGGQQLGELIQAVSKALSGLGVSVARVDEEPLKPAVPIKKSITSEYLVCLEDGKKLKMLKRHLRSTYGMTPDDYRAKWGLAADYPMVAPNYAAQRSAFAKEIGLGRGPGRGTAKRRGAKG